MLKSYKKVQEKETAKKRQMPKDVLIKVEVGG